MSFYKRYHLLHALTFRLKLRVLGDCIDYCASSFPTSHRRLVPSSFLPLRPFKLPSTNVLSFVHPFYSYASSYSPFCHLPPRDNPFNTPLVIGVYAYVYLLGEAGFEAWGLRCREGTEHPGLLPIPLTSWYFNPKGWDRSIDDYAEFISTLWQVTTTSSCAHPPLLPLTILPSSSMNILPDLTSSIHAHCIVFVILPPVARHRSLIRYASPVFLVILVYICMGIS